MEGIAESASAPKGRSGAAHVPTATPTVITQGVVELPTRAKSFASSRVEGKLARILVEHGEHVEKGQVLAEIDSLTVRTMQLELRAAQYRLDWLEKSLARIEPLARAKTVAERELWKLSADRDAAVHEVRSLARQLSLVGFDADHQMPSVTAVSGMTERGLGTEPVEIRALHDGWIADFDLVPGQVVGAMEPLFEIHNLENVWVRCFLFEAEATRIRLGALARITFVFDPDLRVEGRVVRIAPVAEGAQRVIPVWIELPNPQQRLREGMLASVAVEVEAEVVPIASAVRR
jgi:cobalt-zinc-cadmium efflux system membrane fusion protein